MTDEERFNLQCDLTAFVLSGNDLARKYHTSTHSVRREAAKLGIDMTVRGQVVQERLLHDKPTTDLRNQWLYTCATESMNGHRSLELLTQPWK